MTSLFAPVYMVEAIRSSPILLSAAFGKKYSIDVKAAAKAPELKIGISKYGKGLFANQNILKGSIVSAITGKSIKFDEAVLLGEKESYPFQVDLFEYIAHNRNDTWQIINHSCNSNCGVNENLDIIAIKNIKKGDELFYDYSTTMLERHWTMKCQCSSKKCRQFIGDFDTLSPKRQKYYLRKNVVQKFIVNFLRNVNG